NRKAIEADGYDFEAYKETIKKIYLTVGLTIDKDGMFCGTDKDWAKISAAGNIIKGSEWFRVYHITKWIGYEKDDDTDEYYYAGDAIKSFLKYFPERAMEGKDE
ncbi:MAG: hypothetical protein LBP54_08120, partial [Campylobacteraceae bacterium]|nr:hypothetical protein [Campylobacteraceae bacterium]